MEYNLTALIERFDTRLHGHTGLTGRLSSLIGEAVLLDGVAHAYNSLGHRVSARGDRPHRDNAAFVDVGAEIPSQRDLDAWLVLDNSRLVAVECKTWTSSSMDGRSVARDSVQGLASREWQELEAEHFQASLWTAVNKIGLPLKTPEGFDPAATERVLAVWRPVSEDGRSPWSETSMDSIVGGRLAPVTVKVFSMSLYVRALLEAGVETIPCLVTDTDVVVSALDAVCVREVAHVS